VSRDEHLNVQTCYTEMKFTPEAAVHRCDFVTH